MTIDDIGYKETIMKNVTVCIVVCLMAVLFAGSCELFGEEEDGAVFPAPVQIFAMNVYDDQLIGAHGVNAYIFAAPGNYSSFRVEVSHLTTNCDMEVYEYDSSSDKYEDQDLLRYSKQSVKVTETVTLPVETGIQYLIIVEEKDGQSGSFWVYAGI